MGQKHTQMSHGQPASCRSQQRRYIRKTTCRSLIDSHQDRRDSMAACVCELVLCWCFVGGLARVDFRHDALHCVGEMRWQPSGSWLGGSRPT
jgi:hypothetical protein